jgi:hypothetical protein
VGLGGHRKGRRIWWMYFAFMYEDRTMKPVEIVLKKGGRTMEVVNPAEMYCKHIYRYDSVSPGITNLC